MYLFWNSLLNLKWECLEIVDEGSKIDEDGSCAQRTGI